METAALRQRPSESGPRRSRGARGLRLRLAIAWYVARKLGPPLIAVALYAVAATYLVRWDLARGGHQVADFWATLYGLFTQLFFEISEPFPPSRISRIVYFVTPLMGAVLIAEGLLKVGASLFDPTTRIKVWSEIVSEQMHRHIVLCGLGHVGYRVLEELRRLGEDVVCIERSEKDSFVDIVRARGTPVHVGDARRDDLVRAAGIARAKAIVCATNDDLANLEIALDAKRMNPSVRVVMRMFDQRLAGKVGGALELDQSFSTSALAAPLIAIQATEQGVHAAYRVDETIRVTAEVTLGTVKGAGTVAHLEDLAPCRIVSRRPASAEAFSPAKSADAVHPGDVLIVDTAAVDLPSVRFRFGG